MFVHIQQRLDYTEYINAVMSPAVLNSLFHLIQHHNDHKGYAQQSAAALDWQKIFSFTH